MKGFDLLALLKLLTKSQVEFVVIGGGRRCRARLAPGCLHMGSSSAQPWKLKSVESRYGSVL